MDRRKFSYKAGLFLYIAVILGLGIKPPPALPPEIDLSLLYHVPAFFFLYLVLSDFYKSKTRAIVISLGLAVLLEVIQKFSPGRQADLKDILFDALGIFSGYIIGKKGRDIVFKLTGTFLGTGYSPVAPGTVASFLTVVVYYCVGRRVITSWELFLVVLTVGIYVSSYLEERWGEDPSRVVIDEVAGVLIPVFLVHSIRGYLVAFILFRFFDIAKPLSIRKLEKAGSGLGIMLDDVGAGFLALIALYLLLILQRILQGIF